MEAKRVTKEEIKEDTRDGTPQEVNKETKEEVKASSRTANGIALSAAAGGTLPPTAQEELTRLTKSKGGQQELRATSSLRGSGSLYRGRTASRSLTPPTRSRRRGARRMRFTSSSMRRGRRQKGGAGLT